MSPDLHIYARSDIIYRDKRKFAAFISLLGLFMKIRGSCYTDIK